MDYLDFFHYLCLYNLHQLHSLYLIQHLKHRPSKYPGAEGRQTGLLATTVHHVVNQERLQGPPPSSWNNE